MLLVLFLISAFGAFFPPFFVILVCIGLGIPTAQTLVYLTTLRKTTRQKWYAENSLLSIFNNGRIIVIVVSSFVSIFAAFFVFMELSTWPTHIWITLAILIPVFFVIHIFALSFLRTQLRSFYCNYFVAIWSMAIIPIAMTIFYFFVYDRFVTEGILAGATDFRHFLWYHRAHNMLLDSPSALIAIIAQLTAMYNALRAFLFAMMPDPLSIVFTVWNILIYAAIFFSVTSMLIFFMIPKTEFRRNYRPLSMDETIDPNLPIMKKNIATLASCVVVIIVIFMLLESYARRGNIDIVIDEFMDTVVTWFVEFINRRS